jgi:hypothetical protein
MKHYHMTFTIAMRIENIEVEDNTLEESSLKKKIDGEHQDPFTMLVYNTISNICVPPSSIGVTYIPFSLLFSLDLVDGVITAFKQSYTKR